MKNLTTHQIKTSSNPVIVHNTGSSGPSNSSAARWAESSATPDCFATAIRDRAIMIEFVGFDDAFQSEQSDNINL